MFKAVNKKNIITLGVMFFLLSMFLSVSYVFAEDYGLNQTTGEMQKNGQVLPGPAPTASAKDFLAGQVGKIIGFFLAFTGVAFMILMIVAGTIWMNAGGNEQTVAKAKAVIIAAVIGLIITLAAYAITKLLGDLLMTPPTP